MHIQLTLGQYGFELCGSTYMQIFFNKYTVDLLYFLVLHLWIQPTLSRKLYFCFSVGNLGAEGQPTVCIVLCYFM